MIINLSLVFLYCRKMKSSTTSCVLSHKPIVNLRTNIGIVVTRADWSRVRVSVAYVPRCAIKDTTSRTQSMALSSATVEQRRMVAVRCDCVWIGVGGV